jgi:hypothetical protein
LNSQTQSFPLIFSQDLAGAQEAGQRAGGLRNQTHIIRIQLNQKFDFGSQEVNFVIQAAFGSSLLDITLAGTIKSPGIKTMFSSILIAGGDDLQERPLGGLAPVLFSWGYNVGNELAKFHQDF